MRGPREGPTPETTKEERNSLSEPSETQRGWAGGVGKERETQRP